MNISAQEANVGNSELVLQLRNQAESRAASVNSAYIPTSEHELWYSARLKEISSQPFWIFSESNQEIGYVRLDNSKDYKNCFEISISLDSKIQNKGAGTKVLNQAITMASINFTSKNIIAKVNKNNIPSVKLFTKIGFTKLKTSGKFLFFEKIIPRSRFVFRADASRIIGTGHVMRILGLMEELTLRKFEVIFIGDISEFDWIKDQIDKLNLVKVHLKESEFISNKLSDTLILDSYDHKTESSFIKLDKWKSVIVVFDDETPNYKATLKLHPGLKNNWLIAKEEKVISGANFIPLRESIKRIESENYLDYPRIAVVGGGIDGFNFVPEMSKILSRLTIKFEANFFTSNPVLITFDPRFNVFPIGSGFDSIANQCDLAFVTASTTSLEFIARGCAIGMCCTADNQQQYYEDLPKLGVAISIGKFEGNKWNLDFAAIELLVSSKEVRNKLHHKSKDYIDFQGKNRIINEIISL